MSNERLTRNKSRTLHFMRFLGKPKNIHEITSVVLGKFATMEFQPKLGGYAYATNGMSENPQPYNSKQTLTELYITCSKQQSTIFDLIKDIAEYPFKNGTHFALFDTIDIKDTSHTYPYKAIIFAPPEPEYPIEMGLMPKMGLGDIFVHRIVGITSEERDFAIENGGKVLWEYIIKKYSQFHLDRTRELN